MDDAIGPATMRGTRTHRPIAPPRTPPDAARHERHAWLIAIDTPQHGRAGGTAPMPHAPGPRHLLCVCAVPGDARPIGERRSRFMRPTGPASGTPRRAVGTAAMWIPSPRSGG